MAELSPLLNSQPQSMSALHATVLTAFKNKGWAYREVSEMEVVESNFEAYHTKVPVHVQSYGDMHVLGVVATASLNVPHTHKSRAAELLMRVNRDLNLGNFELDWDQGTVVFRQGQVFSKHRYDESIIVNLVHNAIAEMDRLTPYLAELCKSTAAMLPLLDLQQLLRREDLLPVVPEDDEDEEKPLQA